MPSSIPYDPSLVLGSIVTQEKLDNVTEISSLQSPANDAEDALNSLISLKRSIDMTVQDMINMGIDPKDLIKESDQTGQEIEKAAVAYAKAKIDSEKKILPLKAKIRGVNDSYESPINYNRTKIKKMPLSADSLKMNCQYFHFDRNSQDSSTHAMTVSAFVSNEVSFLGDSSKEQAKSAVQSQMNSQHQNHSIEGTLVISITCTHKQAALLAPFIIDVDKGIRVWNKIFPDSNIKPDSIASMMQISQQADTKKEKTLSLISGATYGSSFIGMVHVLNTSETTSSQKMYSVAESVQGQFKVGGWFSSESGGFGVDSSFSGDIKNLLSTQSISSHCSLVVMGSIPSIKSKTVEMGVKQFADDPDGPMGKLAQLQNATADQFTTIDSAANNARTGAQMISLETAKVTGVLSSLADIQKESNQMINVNSMFEAMDDYIDKCIAGNIGVPINYYIKPITRSQLAEMWVSKYYPGKYLSISGDDSGEKDSGDSSGGDSGSDGGGDAGSGE